MDSFQTFYETFMRGPIVSAEPGQLGSGNTGKELYLTALDFISRHHRILKSDIKPIFDASEWIDAPIGTELSGRPKFIINDMLIATLAWVPTGSNQKGNKKGHWRLLSMHMNR